MNKEDFKKYVIAEAKKHLFSTESEVPAKPLNSIKENATIASNSTKLNPNEIKNLAEEIKKINKKIDLRNPLMSESGESFVENIINENKHVLREREVDVDDINKKKHIGFQNEGEKDTWNRMMGYNVPTDEDRS
jgi:hypothetical protein